MGKLTTVIKARYLRKEGTKTEVILWEKLRNRKLGIKFRRQHPVDMYILDFYAPIVFLAIELDGSVHSSKEDKEYDETRSHYLESKGIRLIRFWNSEVEKDIESVLYKIHEKVDELLRV